jgi:carboxylesterase type B
MGESAGAQSIVVHMQSWKEYTPKFHKAIIMSAYPLVTTIYLNQAEGIGEQIVETVGCDFKDTERVMECMRSLPAEELLVARTPRLQFFGSTYRETMLLINDGTNFKSSARVFFTGKYDLNIPVIIGAAAQEGTLFAKIAFPFVSMTEHIQISMLASFSRHYMSGGGAAMIHTLLQNYTRMSPEFANKAEPDLEAYSALVGDSYFLCPSLRLLNALSQKQAAFGYIFTHVSEDFSGRHLGAHHGGDLKYVFGADASSMVSHTEQEKKFANSVVTYFSKFVKTGTPGGPNLPSWPIYAPTGKLMSLEPELKVIEHYKEDVCAFWEKNFPSGIAYTGENYLHPSDESFTSKLFNKYPFMALFFLWRKRRFAKPVLGLLSIVTVLFWYKVITKCCCRNKNTKKTNTTSNTITKQKTQ